LGDTKSIGANVVASGLMVSGWGYFLVQGVRDPLGGINSLWPLFGIANQMLAAIALCLATTILLKMALGAASSGERRGSRVKSPWMALVTLVPLVWLVSVTFTAGVQKIWHSDPRIGFLAQADVQAKNIETAKMATNTADQAAYQKAAKELKTALRLYWNNMVDAVVAGAFLALASAVILLSVREWWLLLSRRKPAVLSETEPVWLPDYAVKEAGPDLRTAAGTAAIALGLAKELSGEAALERAQQDASAQACVCAASRDAAYLRATEARFTGVRRCC
jgi:carbon starvation protein